MRFADIQRFPPTDKPFTIFMAGSPGAGKTELSKAFIKKVEGKDLNIIRVDADEIREIIPQFTGSNSSEVQAAAALGVEKLVDYTQHNRQNSIIDATFANEAKAIDNVKRALKKGYKVGIMYVYQDPKLAWEFTKEREKLEGRPVPKEVFLKSFFSAKESTNKVKDLFGSRVFLAVVAKNFENKVKKVYLDVEKIDNCIKMNYTESLLDRIIQ